jgi:FtsP/CotA-like multicopper oxidase with cupredoxin domain
MTGTLPGTADADTVAAAGAAPESTRRNREYYSVGDGSGRMSAPSRPFPTDPPGLPEAQPPAVVELSDGVTYELRIEPVAKRIGDSTVRMLAYNRSVPGPCLRVGEGTEVVVDVENHGDLETTVHWHGLRLENRYDGTHETQDPIEVGGRFTYRLQFPDPGAYWFHPHIRQDYGQELGLYAPIIVEPADPDYWPRAHREIAVTVDDILLEDGRVAAFDREQTTYSAMGRFGDHLLANGETDLRLDVTQGEVVRFFFVNTANTRVFNVAFTGARMKLVGGDSGRVEHEQFVDSAILAPSERVVVDVLFDTPGEAVLEHRTPEKTYRLGTITVADGDVNPGPREAFEQLRTNPDMASERERIAPYLDAEPDKVLALVAEMDFDAPEGAVVFSCPMHPDVISDQEGKCPHCGMKLMPTAAVVVYTCPMHPAVVSEQPGKCPQCAMKLMPTAAAIAYVCPMHPDVISDREGGCPHCGMKLMPKAVVAAAGGGEAHHDHEHAAHVHGEHEAHGAHEHAHGGIEWEDDMVDVNRTTTPANTRWRLVDRATGAAGHDIEWKFTVGDQVKIRLVNEMDSDHPMHHPFHIHGAGRFLVLTRDGEVEPNLVWTDTVLVRTGEVLDLLLDVTHPGRWMAHCHIAEHHESGMMLNFDVAEAEGAS